MLHLHKLVYIHAYSIESLNHAHASAVSLSDESFGQGNEIHEKLEMKIIEKKILIKSSENQVGV